MELNFQEKDGAIQVCLQGGSLRLLYLLARGSAAVLLYLGGEELSEKLLEEYLLILRRELREKNSVTVRRLRKNKK